MTMQTERRSFLKRALTAVVGLFIVRAPAAPARPKPTILTFYHPSRLFVAPFDPSGAPNPKDNTKYWLNAISGKFFKFEDGKWSRLPECAGLEMKIEGRDIGRPTKFADPDGPCGEPIALQDGQIVHIEDPSAEVREWVRSLPSLNEIQNGVWDQGKKVLDFPSEASGWVIGPKA